MSVVPESRPYLPLFRSGDRSPLFFWGGGAAKPLSIGDYAGPRSMLAFWMGGAALNYIPRPPEPERELIIGGEGIPFAKHHGKPIDDEEIIEFLKACGFCGRISSNSPMIKLIKCAQKVVGKLVSKADLDAIVQRATALQERGHHPVGRSGRPWRML